MTRAILWIALAGLCISAIWLTAQRREMLHTPLSQRLSEYAIPTSISALRGLRDYSAYMEIGAFFIHHKHVPIAKNIESGLLTQIQNPAYRWFFSGDDKGLTDLVYFSFAFFGPYISSLYIGVSILALASILIYVGEFYRSSQRMALLVALFTGFYVVLFTFGLSDQSSNILEPRFIGFLGVIPLLHIVLVVLDGATPSGWTIARTNAQIVLLVFVVHVRTSELWQILCIALACLIGLYFRRNWRVSLGIFAVIGSLVVAGALYRGKTYNREYRTTDITTRVLWHNAIMGLAINQTIRERFSLRTLDDGSVTEAVRTFLKDTNQAEALNSIFAKADYGNGNFFGFKWSEYEEKARECYFHILRQMPIDVFHAYAVDMPKVFIANISHMSGIAFLPGHVWQAGNWRTPEQRMLGKYYLNPLSPIAMAMFAMMLLLLLMHSSEAIDVNAILAIGLVSACSMIPPALATPVFQYIQVSTILLAAGAYFLFGLVAARGSQKLIARGIGQLRRGPRAHVIF